MKARNINPIQNYIKDLLNKNNVSYDPNTRLNLNLLNMPTINEFHATDYGYGEGPLEKRTRNRPDNSHAIFQNDGATDYYMERYNRRDVL